MALFIKAKKKKNQELVEEIILEHYNQYYRLAYSYVHNEDDALDIVQNGAYKAIKGSHTLHNQEYAKTWVYRVMLNEIFKYAKQPKFISYDAMLETDEKGVGYQEDAYADIDLQRVLDSLAPEEKAIILLRFFEDKKIEEIAELLGENINTIKSRLYRCMKKMRITLSEDANQNIV